ncbi:unnamed protein product [Debaryomyces fabryi]|nr:unnamed protein product [Debaryomyces fabryi]
MGHITKLSEKDMSENSRSRSAHFSKSCYPITENISSKYNNDSTYSIQTILNSILNVAISCYDYFLKIIKNYKRTKMEKKSKEELHLNRTEFIALVLERLPFLYTHSKEVENAQWIKIAYDLKMRDKLIPNIVRYQTGPYYFISFGSISTQIKRQFFLLFLKNDKTGNSQMIYPTKKPVTKFSSHESWDSYCNIPIKIRKNAANEFFEYLTSEEIKSIILNGDRSHVDFHEDTILKDDSQKDWFHKWGYVYETESDCYRALDLELKNYSLELTVLDNLLKLGVSYSEVPKTSTLGIETIKDLIEEKRALILETYIPGAVQKKAIKADQLSKYKANTAKYNELMCY